MRRTLSFLLVLVPWLPLPCAAQIPPKDNYVLTESDAYILMPPEIATGPIVKRAVWSNDGRYLLVERESNPLTQAILKDIAAGNPTAKTPTPDVSLLVWSSESRKTTEVWKSAMGQGGVEEIHWLPDSAVAYLKIWVSSPSRGAERRTEYLEQLVRLNASIAQVKVVAEGDQHGFQIHVSPTRTFALIEKAETISRQTQGPNGAVRTVTDRVPFLYLLRENGTFGSPMRAPYGHGFDVRWSASGAEPILRILDCDATKKLQNEKKRTGIAVWRWFNLDPLAGKWDSLPEAPNLYQPRNPESPIRIKPGNVSAKEGETSTPVSLLWLESAVMSDRPRALVNANVQNAELSPGGGGILQIAQGATIVTPIMKMPRALFAKMPEDAQRITAISNGNQLGLDDVRRRR